MGWIHSSVIRVQPGMYKALGSCSSTGKAVFIKTVPGKEEDMMKNSFTVHLFYRQLKISLFHSYS